LEITLRAWGIGPGDEVIVPSITWISTAEAVSYLGATPVFADILPDYYTINPEEIKKKITKQTKAIIPVHLYGLPADMPSIMPIAQEHDLLVLEDCAQAHGASIKGQKVGTFGHAASFSFYPGKNLGAYGDAGAICTHDHALAQKCRTIANHGQTGKHNHVMIGRNSRMDTMQAAVLNVKLPYLEQWVTARQKNALAYNETLHHSGLLLPKIPDSYEHAYHLYVVRTENRDKVKKQLADKGIQTAVHYPKALPNTSVYAEENTTRDYPVGTSYQDMILSLPMYPELSTDQIKFISRALAE